MHAEYRWQVWRDGEHFIIFEIVGGAETFELCRNQRAVIRGTLDEIRNYLKDQLGEDYYEICKEFWRGS